ncbi:protein of unknown function [Tenacibaculum sp. 190130A14a]|uniref:Peptidase C39 domain-containing protein n=1 Tax=Tenacibaculum polynesiense TaxID=3137857 RepID=A0ABM9PG30_9FLAO
MYKFLITILYVIGYPDLAFLLQTNKYSNKRMKNDNATIKFKQQPFSSMLCGQTCLSMITGESIEDISKELGKDWETDIYEHIMPFLSKRNYNVRAIKVFDITFEEVPNESIILFRYPNGNGHFVIKHNDRYFDPAIGIVNQYLANRKITNYLTFEKKEA